MDIKNAIFDLLQGTYGLPAEAVAERLAAPAAEVRVALEQMLAEGRLWQTDEGKYRCVLPPPPWMEAVKEAMYCEGWPGLAYFYVAEDCHLELYPAPFVREGGEAAGVCFMGDWHAELGPLLDLFDGEPAVTFGAAGDGTSLSLEGTINGADAWIELRDRPPEDLPPDLLMTRDGGFRELTEEEQEAFAALQRDDARDEDDGPPRLRGLWTPSEN